MVILSRNEFKEKTFRLWFESHRVNFIIFFLRTICQVSVWDSFLFIAFCFTKTKTENWKTSSTKSLNMIFNTIRKLAFFLPCLVAGPMFLLVTFYLVENDNWYILLSPQDSPVSLSVCVLNNYLFVMKYFYFPAESDPSF